MNEEKIYVYIDGANLDKGTSTMGWKIDYVRFYIWLKDKYAIHAAYIFIGYIAKYQGLYQKMRKAGFILIFKETTLALGYIKGNCDADIVLYAVRDVYENFLSKAFIVSSDGDFSNLVLFLKNKSKMGSIISPSNKCSILLHRTEVPIVYLDQIKNNISL